MRSRVSAVFWLVGLLAASCSTGSSSGGEVASASEAFFADHGITFVYPEDWDERDLDELAWPARRFVVAPDQRSGNWISFVYLPRSVADDWDATEETFGFFLNDLVNTGSQTITRGPTEIEYGGVGGLEVQVEGIVGERTGQPLAGEIIVLFGEEASYLLIAQYELEGRDSVLSAW